MICPAGTRKRSKHVDGPIFYPRDGHEEERTKSMTNIIGATLSLYVASSQSNVHCIA